MLDSRLRGNDKQKLMLQEITDKNEWEKLREARTIASGRFLQSWAWGEFQRSVGRKVFRFAGDSAIAQVIELPLPFGKKYWFCPKGPIPAIQDSRSRIQEFFNELKNKAKGGGAVFLRIEPAEKAAGIKTKDISPACTSIFDLAKSEEELLVAMHPKTRYNIKVAMKHGVVVRSSFIVHRSFDEIWDLFEETARRDGFRTHERGYYEKQVLMPEIKVFCAEHEGKDLAAAIVFFDGDTATYLHGASSSVSRNVMAPYALHWEIMRYAKARGCARYDLWGISDDPKSGWAGITRFKRGWGGADLCGPGAYDLPVDRFWYSVYRLARRMRP
jgi:peptidoglycan pentaglycine glycine transferase (the first glycine)